MRVSAAASNLLIFSSPILNSKRFALREYYSSGPALYHYGEKHLIYSVP